MKPASFLSGGKIWVGHQGNDGLEALVKFVLSTFPELFPIYQLLLINLILSSDSLIEQFLSLLRFHFPFSEEFMLFLCLPDFKLSDLSYMAITLSYILLITESAFLFFIAVWASSIFYFAFWASIYYLFLAHLPMYSCNSLLGKAIRTGCFRGRAKCLVLEGCSKSYLCSDYLT